MPASAYSQQLDQATGKIIWVPQLYPFASCTGEIPLNDLECWLRDGDIPKELYRADFQSLLKMTEIQGRLQKGEKVYVSELPPDQGSLTAYILRNKARLFGENVLKKIYANLDDHDPDIVWLSFVREACEAIASEDPLAIHFYLARKTLKEKYQIEAPRAIDILARGIVNHLRNILRTFNSFKHPVFHKHFIEVSDLNNHLEATKLGILQLDAEFIGYLKKIGSKGKELAARVAKNSIDLFKFYKESNFSEKHRRKVWGLWVPGTELVSACLNLLAQAIWEAECNRQWKRETEGFPSIPRPYFERIMCVLNQKFPSDNFIEKDINITFNDFCGVPLITAPAVDVGMISAFKRGFKALGSLTGHKILRWEVNIAYEQWCKGKSDPRLIEIEGGYSKIAELAKCPSKTDIAKIKEILHVQAYGHFIFPEGSHGNMITFRIKEKYKNNEPSRINIVLGDMLWSPSVCQLPKSNRRLIPIGDLPPLYGSPNSHANQAMLQLLVFQEFSDQSIRLAKCGSVLIPIDKWKQLADESGISPDKLESIIAYWCQIGLANAFLEKEGDEYRFSSHYQRVQKFLENQGRERAINSQRGKKSAALRIKGYKTSQG